MKKTHTNTHTNVWKKTAYKCMRKTRIQNRIQMYDKNTHTNMHPDVWKKHTNASKWELPRLQLSAHQSFFWAVSGDWTANPLVIGRPHSPLSHGRPYKCMKKTCIQMYEKNTHTNVWKKPHTNVWKKQTHTNVDKITHTKTHTNVWQNHAYKHAYKYIKKHAYKVKSSLY